MIFTLKNLFHNGKAGDIRSDINFAVSETKFIVHFYHGIDKGIRYCDCQIKEIRLDKSVELVTERINCSSEDNYVKAIGRKLSLIKACRKLMLMKYPLADDVMIHQFLIQLNKLAPRGMQLAKGVNLPKSVYGGQKDDLPFPP